MIISDIDKYSSKDFVCGEEAMLTLLRFNMFANSLLSPLSRTCYAVCVFCAAEMFAV